MKRLGTLVATTFAVTLCAVALAATKLSGTYNATITKAGALNGSWSVTFSGTSYTIGFKGATAVKGVVAQSGNRLTFADRSGKYAWPAKGVYTYSLNGRTLTFKAVSDSKCAGRRVVLAARYTKKFSSSGPGGY
jgi:hypothetical protein